MRVLDRGGFTLIELLMVVAIIGVVAAIAVPGLMRARISGNEASAIGSLRMINSGQWAFHSTCGSGFFASSLIELGTTPSGSASPFVTPDLGSTSSPTKSGYTFTMAGTAANNPGITPCITATLVSGYHAEANPVSAATGTRHFGTNTTQTIFQDLSAITMQDTGSPSGSAKALQ